MPEIYLSVLAQGATTDTFRVLVQGALLTSANALSLLTTLKNQLKHLEIDIAQAYLNTYSLDIDALEALCVRCPDNFLSSLPPPIPF